MGSLLERFVAMYPDFKIDPACFYTLRYVFYCKPGFQSDEDKPCTRVSHVTGLWSDHEVYLNRVRESGEVSSCIVEYVCEYDSTLLGGCVVGKEKDKEEN